MIFRVNCASFSSEKVHQCVCACVSACVHVCVVTVSCVCCVSQIEHLRLVPIYVSVGSFIVLIMLLNAEATHTEVPKTNQMLTAVLWLFRYARRDSATHHETEETVAQSAHCWCDRRRLWSHTRSAPFVADHKNDLAPRRAIETNN